MHICKVADDTPKAPGALVVGCVMNMSYIPIQREVSSLEKLSCSQY